MASRSKGKRKPSGGTPFDLEALGLVLLALGIFTLGFLLPVLPTGELGSALREAVLGRVGWGGYLLPWPMLVLGGFFLLRKNPKPWPRMLLGYAVLGVGGWLLVMLLAPEQAGHWGVAMREGLGGTLGGLAYLLALLVVSLGLERLANWPPLTLARAALRLVVQGVRQSYKGVMAWRGRAKAKAAFHADVALARRTLKELDRDLEALRVLYPGSVELDRWRKAVAKSVASLRQADEAALTNARADAQAWRDAVDAFTQERAGELRLNLKSEGLEEFDLWLRALEKQLADPVARDIQAARALDQVRRTLAFDLTALKERYKRLTRERDLAEAELKEISPRALIRAFEAHHLRLGQYKSVQRSAVKLDRDADLLEQWRGLVHDLAALQDAYPDAAALSDYDEALAQELQGKGREALEQLEGWRHALSDVRQRLLIPIEPRPEVLALDEEGFEEAPLDEEIESEASVAAEAGAWDAGAVEAEEAVGADEALEADDAVPEVGGIPIQLPSYELLDPPLRSDEDPVSQARELRERVSRIDETLANFKLQGRVVSSVRGPTVTRFEVEPAPGEKISRFAGLSDDLALAMAVGSVRIEAPIPGKSVIGLEVPNASRDLIRFREAAEAASFKRTKARLPLILGKSIDGEMVVGDLAKMPHLLIAGSTGSGKSVAVNTLIGSLLYKFLPTELRFLMIDPKMVELTPFDGIPHLLRPVVTNPNDAAGVLLGAVAHMERRYKMMSKIGAKNLDQYNEKARNLELPELPFIVIVIDELADLMITSPKEVESAIMRLAQMARATGMHLILATQRPSVDILTSLIKVNVPARVAFAVSSGHDSRTILDTMGAERLIGSGDMLFYQPGLIKPMRLQGPFISEAEIYNLASFLRRQYFDDDFVEAYGADFDPPPLDDASASGMVDWNDDKLREAAELVVSEGQASVSRLQRRLGVGHARAGKLMDSLEALGVVGPHLGSKPREVLVTLDELPNVFGR